MPKIEGCLLRKLCGIESLFNKGFENIRNIYEIYTNIYKIYTKYEAAARRRLPGQAPRRGPGPARAPRGLAGQPPPGRRLVFCIYLVYICIYFVYISYIFRIFSKPLLNRLSVLHNFLKRSWDFFVVIHFVLKDGDTNDKLQ